MYVCVFMGIGGFKGEGAMPFPKTWPQQDGLDPPEFVGLHAFA